MIQIYNRSILIVDDEQELLNMVEKFLLQAGFQNIYKASSCKEAREIFASVSPDAALLDVTLPDGDGFTLLQEFRVVKNLPVLFLSARDEDENRLMGLGLGADDYITKPFLPKELTLRLTAVLKRVYPPSADHIVQPDILKLGNTVVDWGSGIVTKGQDQQSLTAKEYALLKKLYENQGNIVTIDSLCLSVWKDGTFGYENTLMVHIRRLREKIEADPSHPIYLLTVRGLGYKLAREDHT